MRQDIPLTCLVQLDSYLPVTFLWVPNGSSQQQRFMCNPRLCLHNGAYVCISMMARHPNIETVDTNRSFSVVQEYHLPKRHWQKHFFLTGCFVDIAMSARGVVFLLHPDQQNFADIIFKCRTSLDRRKIYLPFSAILALTHLPYTGGAIVVLCSVMFRCQMKPDNVLLNDCDQNEVWSHVIAIWEWCKCRWP